MLKSTSYRIALIGFLIASILAGCNRKDHLQGTQKNALFQLVDPKESRIDFSNELQETDSSNSIFYEYFYNGAGLAIGDVNNDGLSDILFGANMTNCRLYLNKGNLKFEDVTDKVGINTINKWITGVSLVDINQDGWLDIYLCAGGNILDDYHNLMYINNGNKDALHFTECASKLGLDDNGYSTQANFFDYDRDGDLDLYLVTSSMKIPNKNIIRLRKDDGSVSNTDRLYRNDGIDHTSKLPVFTNVSLEAGIVWDGFGLGSCVCDLNRDGWPDIYVCNDYISNDLLYVNQQNGTFKEMIKLYTKHTSYSTMGMDIADFNNDGLIDIFTLDMQPEDYYRKRIMALNMRDYRRYMNELDAGYSNQYIRNMLQMNIGEIEGQYRFSEIGQLANVFETDWSWAPLFADFDNDGFRDLFIGNGIHYDMTNMDFSELWLKMIKANPSIEFSVLYKILKDDLNKKDNIKKPNVIFRNTGGLIFENKTTAWGLEKPLYSTGSAFSDLDNDGDLDLILNNINDKASIYENTLLSRDSLKSKSHFISLLLKGDSLNTGGIGTKVTLYHNGRLQYYEHFPVRGFQSMVDPKIHFGLGASESVDSIIICWPDEKVQKLHNVQSDQFIEVRYTDAKADKIFEKRNEENRFFIPVSETNGITYIHKERQFIDFDIQPLVPHQYSKEGPGIAVGDINSDGLDDFFIGGSTSFSGMFFVQGNSSTFRSYQLQGENNYEDMGALLFDADGDGDNDLYVVSGGSGLPPGIEFYNDRLYVNNGSGRFTIAREAILDERVCGSHVTAADFDRDGDLDLFVCGRVTLENYPMPPRSFLLRNDSKGSQIQFSDVTSTVSPELERPGLLASALWTDLNRDGWPDLILAGEWMPVMFFKNEQGKLRNITASAGLDKYTGWWNSIAAGDFDRDGDMDYAVGNLGLNTQYKVSASEPMRIMAKDFDLNGTLDPVCSYYVQGKSYPIYHRNVLLSQIPSLKNTFTTYESYARASIDDIFPEETRKDAYIRECKYFESSWIENLGDETFKVHALPVEAQFSPVFGILAGDYDYDGNCDLILTGNSYSSNVFTGQYDASTGLFLSGDGEGGFTSVLGRNSGFFVDGDAKALAELSLKDGSSLILAAQNSDTLKVFKPVSKSPGSIRLRKDEVYAEVTFSNGKKSYHEFHYGSGYLSQSSRVLKIPENAVSVEITTYKGEKRSIQFSKK